MKLDCSLVEDLYPLYKENKLNLKNRHSLEKHVSFCSKCNNLYMTESGKEKFAKETDDRIHLRFRLMRMKIIVLFLLALIIVTGINRYAANREKVATHLDGMYQYSESLNELAKNPYEFDSNSEFLTYTVDDIIDLDNELTLLERNPLLKNTAYHFFVNSRGLDEMAVNLKERKKQGLADETDAKVIELFQEQTETLFKQVKKEYESFHHGYSSYFEFIDVKGIGEPISRIEKLAYFYNRYHKLPSDMQIVNKNELKGKITSVFNAKGGKVELKKSINDDPGVYHFEVTNSNVNISGKIDGYTGIVFWAVNESSQNSDNRPKNKEEIMVKANKMLKKVYGNSANFEIKYDPNNEAGQNNIYRLRFTPVVGNNKLILSEPYFIDYDARSGMFTILSAKIPPLSKEFFSKNYKDTLSRKKIEDKAAHISGNKGKAKGKGIIYSTISSDYVLVYIFEGKENFIYINAETGVVEKPYIS
jgi:hypothetical protein